MIQVVHLTKRFGGKTAVNDLSFEVGRGEIVGLLGPNGAGKTTTMRILSCFLTPTSGSVAIGGMDVFHDSLDVRRLIGYLPENTPLYEDMRVNEYLCYRGRLKGLGGKKLRARLDEVVSLCGLTQERRSIIGRLSKGYRQRVALADSLIHDPELLILDEPTLGLDPNQIRHIRALIMSFAPRRTVLLSSHILTEIEMVCKRALIMDQGRIVASDTPETLIGLMKGNAQVIIEARGNPEQIMSRLSAQHGVVKVEWEAMGDWHRFRCECRKDADIRPALFKTVAENKWELREMRMEKGKLEDVFAAMTQREGMGNG